MTRMTRMTRIFTDNATIENCIYLIINDIKISVYPCYLRHLRSKILLRQSLRYLFAWMDQHHRYRGA